LSHSQMLNAGPPPAPGDIPDVGSVDARAATENFVVAARLLPGRFRRDLVALYGYARLVDELGDAVDGDLEHGLGVLRVVQHAHKVVPGAGRKDRKDGLAFGHEAVEDFVVGAVAPKRNHRALGIACELPRQCGGVPWALSLKDFDPERCQLGAELGVQSCGFAVARSRIVD